MQVIDTIPESKPRAVDGHKGDYGKVCIIAGSFGMSGSAALANRLLQDLGGDLARFGITALRPPTFEQRQTRYLSDKKP